MHIVLDFYEQKLNMATPPNEDRNVYAYISDITLGNIVIFNWRKETSWKKTATQMNYNGVSFEILDQWVQTRSGVRGLALESAENVEVEILGIM